MSVMIYQHGTLGTLMAGMLKGTASIDEMLKHGDLGIGTLDGCDGEVIILDNEAFHANEYGEFKKLNGDEMTPFSTVTDFKPNKKFDITNLITSENLLDTILVRMKSQNLFSAVKIHGSFKKVHVRMMPKQEPPYQRLMESVNRQPELTFETINGTIVGFFTPELFHGVGTAGFHLHFVDQERTVGGHVLDFELERGTVEINDVETFEQNFPVHDEEFLNADIDYENIDEEIRLAE
ncbi:acetolactate decarboxylase [Staphylococcus carnosus]|uniref:Alpha-acetolactate decarboxylase n=2 Tax=Staphylococcus carnosus TaxID=1281 RepID=A0AAJ0JR76_STACA|nr:acetolactate decarboxylase [Staphylococcus carnosus]ANZ32552.1 alpha-acetolactate decarboxylase [Staphylococcus carnosus]KKB25913.1 alpha-acetolactate decarboxylase [Staphylococcus carnosus]KOR12990.1 alpha-acetolactate decarboxylase [Staphylococcus carnosus]QPT05104.1 acetolactate decarboxylase [Staphylococcus carnosus]QQS86460.1 acetolactate decarboxylase [Staphylococcus carnosus]